ncbi:hypothetical protein [Labilithrix luteola]|uniref:hypothetical protein n=1 Tax=Labilithrix luteola TaxID=1391654 RepID=UPI0011BA892B|nr:hypothetical protein [Labilithrix luteola]
MTERREKDRRNADPTAERMLGTSGAQADPTREGTSGLEPSPTTPDGGSPQSPPEEGMLCCAMACGPIFENSFWSELDDATLRTSSFSVCRNSECFEATLTDAVPPPRGPGSGIIKQFVDSSEREQSHAPLIELLIWEREAPGAPRHMILSYLPWASNDWRDGDVYELTMKDGEGTVVFHRQTTVTYTISQVCCQTCGHAGFDGGT